MIQTEELKQLLDVQNIGAISLFDFFIGLTELIIINYYLQILKMRNLIVFIDLALK